MPPKVRHKCFWKVSTISHLNRHTNRCESEVQKIVHLLQTANQLPDAFTNTSKVTKSRISAVNTPTQVIVPTKKSSVKQLMTYLLYDRSMTDDLVLKMLFPKREE